MVVTLKAWPMCGKGFATLTRDRLGDDPQELFRVNRRGTANVSGLRLAEQAARDWAAKNGVEIHEEIFS